MQIHEVFHIFLKRKLALPISYLKKKTKKQLDVKENVPRAGKMAQQLRTFYVSPQDHGSVPIWGSQLSVTSVPGHPKTLSGP